MAEIYTWIRNIICYICFYNVFLQVLPGKAYKKYVSFFGSLILLLVVLEPVTDWLNLSNRLEQLWRMESIREELDEAEITMQGMEELRSEKINAAFEAELERQIVEIIKAHGFYSIETNIIFEENSDGVLQISKIDSRISESNKKIDISIGADNEENAGKEDSQEVLEIKKEIQEVYHIPLGNINMNIEE